MIGPAAVRRLARATGFREEAVEKVLYLLAILDRLRGHPDLRDAWVLKGGTAFNLFHLEVPRLSVDLDLNYIGERDLEPMRAARPGFERALVACCEREGCQVRRAPGEHAGGKYRLRYAGGAAGHGSLELDVNFVQRVPLFPINHRRARFPPRGGAGPVPVLAIEELAAGKLTALLTRAAPRDAFDGSQLLELVPDLTERPGFRIAFVVQVASSRMDLREKDPDRVGVEEGEVRGELLPLLRAEASAAGHDAVPLARELNGACREAARRLLGWRAQEREFLDRLLEAGEILPELLTGDPEMQERIAAQPMLRWKAMHVRRFRGLPAIAPEEV